MIVHRDIKQGSAEWLALRSGKMTGSIADKLMTPTGRLSTQYKGEIGRIIAERKGWQAPKLFEGTEWTTRGLDMENEARLWFGLETGLEVEQVAFISDDDGLFGFSPDGLVVVDGATLPLELKVPMPGTHIKWLLDGEVPSDHIAQVHFAMAILGSPAGYFMSYCPETQPLLVLEPRSGLTEQMESAMRVYREEFRKAFQFVTGDEI